MITKIVHGNILIPAGSDFGDFSFAAVNTAKTMVRMGGFHQNISSPACRLQLLNSTNVRAYRANTTQDTYVSFDVVEFD